MPPDNLFLLCSILFLLNIFASTQDIAVDSIAVAVLSQQELGHGNTAQVVGYKIGSIFGGGLLVWFMNFLGWTGLFLVMAVLYIEALMFVFVSPVLRDFENRQLYGKSYQDDDDDDRSDTDSECYHDEDDNSQIIDDAGSVSDISESLPDLIEQPSPSQDNAKSHSDSKPDLLLDNVDLTQDPSSNSESPPKERGDLNEFYDSQKAANVSLGSEGRSSNNSSNQAMFPNDLDIMQHKLESCDNITMEGDKKQMRRGKAQLNESETEDDDSHSHSCGSELSQEEIDSLQSAAEYVPYQSEPKSLVGSISDKPWKIITEVLDTPGTKWMLLYVMVYKLG